MTESLFNYWILLPALVAALAGLVAYRRGRPGWAVGLACTGFVVVFGFAFLCVLAAIVLNGATWIAFVVWGGVLLYWLVAIAIASSLDRKRSAEHNAES